MRIIQDDLTSSMSCTESVLSSTYAISNLLIFPNWNIPSLPWISDSKSCFLTCKVASGMESVFISNLMADSATIQISTSTGESGQIDINTTHYSNLMEIVRNNELGTISPEWFNFSEAPGGATISSPYSGGTISVVTFAPTTLEITGDVTLEADLILSASSNVSEVNPNSHEYASGTGVFFSPPGAFLNPNIPTLNELQYPHRMYR